MGVPVSLAKELLREPYRNGPRMSKSPETPDESTLKPRTEPQLTFWSIPPFRQRAHEMAKTIKLRDARFLIAQVYGMLYLLYGIKIPIILLLISQSIFGTGPAAFDRVTRAIPYLAWAAAVCVCVSGITGGITAWLVTGRAMRSRERHRLRWALWGALGAAMPFLPVAGVVPTKVMTLITGFVLLLFGGAIGAAFHWLVQRDQADLA